MDTLVINNKTNQMKNVATRKSFHSVKYNNAASYVVVHPLFDVPEEKINTDAIGPLQMTIAVKWSLITLRFYLIVMIGLAFYRSMVLAGIL